jgi:histidine triad (HIT) family protein
MGDCIFCGIGSKKIRALVVHEDDELLAFRDINPQAPVHILIIPKQHFGGVQEMGPEDGALLGKMILAAKQIAAQERISGSGYRLVINAGEHGGQTVPHIHVHLLGGRPLTWPPG